MVIGRIHKQRPCSKPALNLHSRLHPNDARHACGGTGLRTDRLATPLFVPRALAGRIEAAALTLAVQ
jgi:hypothetical protein